MSGNFKSCSPELKHPKSVFVNAELLQVHSPLEDTFCHRKASFSYQKPIVPKFGRKLVNRLSRTDRKMVLFETERDLKSLRKKFSTDPGKTFKESNIKDARMFRMEYFRQISFVFFKWKEFQLY